MNDHLLKKDNPLRSSTIKSLASSSKELRPDITETARRVREQKRESLDTQTQSSHFQRRSGMLSHTGGTCSRSGMMDYPRIPITEWNLGKLFDPMEFSKLEVELQS